MNFDVLKPTLFHKSILETLNWQIVKEKKININVFELVPREGKKCKH